MPSITVSSTQQTGNTISAGVAAGSLKPQKRTFSLTGAMGTTIVPGDEIALWGSNDGGSTYQPLRQNGAPVIINYNNPEVVIDDCCTHYASQRRFVGTGSALATCGFNGEADGTTPGSWLVGGNNLGGVVGVLGTNDASDLEIRASGKAIIYSDGENTSIGNTEAEVPGNILELYAGSGGMGLSADGAGSIAYTTGAGQHIFSGGDVRLIENAGGSVTPLRFFTIGGARFVGIQAPAALPGNVTWTLPSSDATITGQSLRSNAAGVMSWAGAINVRASNTNAQSIVDGAAAAIVTTWTEATDSAGAFDAATGVFTVPTGGAGFYRINAEVEFAAIASIVAGEFTVGVYHNGSLIAQGIEICQVAAANVKRNPKVSIGVQLAATDTISIRVSQNSGSGANALTNVAARNFLSIAQTT